MIITKSVKIKVNSLNIIDLTQKGYECERGKIIDIKPKHLTKGSHTKLRVMCVTKKEKN